MVALDVKCVFRAWGQLKRGFEVLALGVKFVLRALGQLKRGFKVLALGEICFEGMWVAKRGV